MKGNRIRAIKAPKRVTNTQGNPESISINTTDIIVYDAFSDISRVFIGKIEDKKESELEDIVAYLEDYKKSGAFGFVDHKQLIHLWVDFGKTSTERLVAIIAHELGHLQKPHHSYYRQEEDKAQKYSHLATMSLRIARWIEEK